VSRRYFESLRPADTSAIDAVPGGLFFVRSVPMERAEAVLCCRIFCARAQAPGRLQTRRTPLLHPKSFMETQLFVRDFGYDPELLSRGEINDQTLVGLEGVVKVSYAIFKGMFYLNFEAFAPSEKWKELSPVASDQGPGSEVA